MMHVLMIFITIMSTTIAAPLGYDTQAGIISYKNENDGLGNYDFSYETTNLIRREESGRVVNSGKSDEHIVVTGQISYFDPDGKYVEVKYVADENGYRILPPTHLPPLKNDPFFTSIPAKLPEEDFEGDGPGSISSNVIATMLGGG